MKKILLHAESYDAFWAHYSLVNDGFFKDEFKKLGYRIYTSYECEPEEADYIIFIEAKTLVSNYFLFRKLDIHKLLKFIVKFFFSQLPKRPLVSKVIINGENKFFNKSYLLVLEGVLDAPENHSIELSKYFKKIFTWNDCLVDNSKFIKTLWPQPVNWPQPNHVKFPDKKLIVNISANKFSKNELEFYSERSRFIDYLDRFYPNEFDLFGFGWNKPINTLQKFFPFLVKKYSTYKGIAEDKCAIFPKYKFAIIYENANVPGWITEKLFDCLRSFCVPIYLGAPNVTNIIPEDIFIDKRKFNSYDDLMDFLLKMKENEYNGYLLRIDQFISSENFKSHLSTSLAKTIVLNL
jgi:hypothetical protein